MQYLTMLVYLATRQQTRLLMVHSLVVMRLRRLTQSMTWPGETIYQVKVTDPTGSVHSMVHLREANVSRDVMFWKDPQMQNGYIHTPDRSVQSESAPSFCCRFDFWNMWV